MSKKSLFPKYQKQLFKICSDHGFWLRSLGEVGGKPMWLIQCSKPNEDNPDLLIVAGFHGEEQAGPWGLLKWLETRDSEVMRYANISAIPVINPTGFNLGKRYNTWNEISNQGFVHPEKKQKLSEEGRILITNKDLIIPAAADGLLSLHEDKNITDSYYIYTFEKSKEPGKFTCGLLDELSKHFSNPLNNITINTDAEDPGPYVVNGVVYKNCDGSFEDWLFHEGSTVTAVTETPAYRTRLQRRIAANVDIIEKFIELRMEET